MNQINLTANGNQNYTVSPNSVDAKDSLVQINTSPITTSTVRALQGFSIEGASSGYLSYAKTVTLKLYQRQFFIVAGGFSQIVSNTTAPAFPLTPISFSTTANQNDYVFNGTVNEYNPNGYNLIGASIPIFTSDGLQKTYGRQWTFDNTTGTITFIGKVYANVLCIANAYLSANKPINPSS
jgi:hypothetical protein